MRLPKGIESGLEDVSSEAIRARRPRVASRILHAVVASVLAVPAFACGVGAEDVEADEGEVVAGDRARVRTEDCATFAPVTRLLGALPGDKQAAIARTLRCGRIELPENRSKSTGKKVDLAIVVAKATKPSKTSAPPLVMITGGPSTPSTDLLNILVEQPVLREERDVVLVGERGEEFATPQLNCSGLDALADGVFGEDGLVHPVTDVQRLPVLRECFADLTARGIDLSAYDVRELVTDIHDAATALGYSKYHVWGVSFGTGAAQALAQLYPDEVASIILDSPTLFWNTFDAERSLAGNPHLDVGRSVTDAWRTLYAACDADVGGCAAKYPNLEATLRAMVADYDASPVELEMTKPGDTSGKTFKWKLTGELVYHTLSNSFSPKLIPFLPQAIVGLRARAPEAIAFLEKQVAATFVVGRDVSLGMEKSVTCSGWNQVDASRLVTADVDDLVKKYMDPITLASMAICRDVWRVPELKTSWPKFHTPLKSATLPALLLPGKYDSNTHPFKAVQIARNLPKAFVHVVPDRGHVTIAPCTAAMTAAFMKNPTRDPDASCLAEMTTTFR